MKQTKTVTIGPDTYEITQLGASLALDLWYDLAKALGPTFRDVDPEVVVGLAKSNPIAGLNILLDLVQNLPRELLHDLRTEFAKTTKVQPPFTLNKGEAPFVTMTEEMFDSHFAGRMKAMSLWFAECFRINFADFLEESGSSSAPEERTPKRSRSGSRNR